MATIFELAARLQAGGAAEATLLLVVKATLVLAIARLVLMALPRASAATKHVIATGALIAVAAMPVLTFVTPSWHLALLAEKTLAPAPADAPRTIGVLGEDGETTATATANEPSAIGTGITLARATGVAAVEEPLTVVSRALNVAKQSWQGMIVLSLLAVAALMLLQLLIGMAGVWYVARKAEELTHDVALVELDRARDHLALAGDVRLLRSSRISVPVIWGIAHPVLLLPADVVMWPAERLRVVLMHELAHLKRLDGLSLILTRFAVSLFWFHPLAWSLERAGRSECERACDDLVLASGTKPSDYADHLLAIAKEMPSFDPFRSVTLAMSRKSQLEGRLLSILQPQVVRRIVTARGVAMGCAVALLVVIPVSAMRLSEKPNKPAAVVYAKKSGEQMKTNAEITVTPDVEAIGDYFLAKLGKHGDKFAKTPTTGSDWYKRGYELYHADRYPEAIQAFERAASEGFRPDAALYNAACSYSLMDDKDNALATLARAIEAGWDDLDHIADDDDLDPIRQDPRFARVVKDAQGEATTRRVTQTMQKFEKLQERSANGDAVADGVKDGVKQGVRRARRDGDDWFDVGLDLLRLRHHDQAIHAFQQAVRLDEKPAAATYNIACAQSLKGDVANGIASLERAINLGFDSLDKLDNDPDIRALRSHSRFSSLREMAKDLRLVRCCEIDPEEEEASSWREAAAHHRAIANKYPNNGRAWFNLGYTALQARDYAAGIDGFNRAISLGHRVGTSSYNIACAHALRGDSNAAFQWLDKARAAGFDLYNYLGSDNDLESLRDDPRFKELRRQTREEANKRGKFVFGGVAIDIDEALEDFDFDIHMDHDEEKHKEKHKTEKHKAEKHKVEKHKVK